MSYEAKEHIAVSTQWSLWLSLVDWWHRLAI